MRHHEDFHDDELARLGDRLRAQRPELTALELDAVRRQVRARIAAPQARKRTRSGFMKSRLAILGMLVLGMVFSTTGAGLAVTGFTGSHDASVAQYGGPSGENNGMNNNGNTPGTGEVLPNNESGGGGPNGGGGTPTNTSPGGGNTAPANEAAVQPARQVETGVGGVGGSSSNLPFTGFAAIPVLIGGLVLLASGLVLRRRSAREG